MIALAVASFTFVTGGNALAATIHVPADAPSIQAGIDAAADGDTVLVAPGTYHERIRIIDKSVTVVSEAGADVTTIDGDGGDGGVSAVTIGAGDGSLPEIRGFTITDGYAYPGSGGGIHTFGAAVIADNRVVGNRACTAGGGIYASASSALIVGNLISGNGPGGCSGTDGGGVQIGSAGTVQFLGNVVENNIVFGRGGGISINGGGAPRLAGNLIRNNRSSTVGGGIGMVNHSNAVIENNVIHGNSAPQGAGIGYLTPFGAMGPAIVNNTIVANVGVLGTAIWAEGFDDRARIANNILSGGGTDVLNCHLSYDSLPPIVEYNDIWGTGGAEPATAGCNAFASGSTNISVDPSFISPSTDDYHLSRTSPLIDSGTNSGAPAFDFDGVARPQDGDGDGIATVDPGAYELVLTGDVTAPVISAPDSVTADATSPAGAIVEYTVTATDDVDSAPDVSCLPSSGSTFAIGTTAVTCTAIDASGNSATATFAVIVRGAAEQIQRLRDSVAAASVDNRLSAALNAKLNRALKNLSIGRVSKVCLELQSFAGQVAAQSGRKVDPVTATAWIADATRIQDVVSC